MLVVLNIILIALLSVLVFYIIKFNNISIKGIFKKYIKHKSDKIEKIEEVIEINNENNLEQERVFIGRFVTDEEYQQMVKSRRGNISVLMEELNNEYEHLKELSK
jgi:hypothetical protein